MVKHFIFSKKRQYIDCYADAWQGRHLGEGRAGDLQTPEDLFLFFPSKTAIDTVLSLLLKEQYVT